MTERPRERPEKENVKELLSVAKAYSEYGLSSFLEEVALVSDLDSLNNDQNSVTLMTMHAAKGLEFPVVFVPGMEESIFPHSRALYDQSEMEEERRLCYVAMTRAKEELYLISASTRIFIWKPSGQSTV
jgi:DNA helicase-2/ATP-dependent DNA helicase PcrA